MAKRIIEDLHDELAEKNGVPKELIVKEYLKREKMLSESLPENDLSYIINLNRFTANSIILNSNGGPARSLENPYSELNEGLNRDANGPFRNEVLGVFPEEDIEEDVEEVSPTLGMYGVPRPLEVETPHGPRIRHARSCHELLSSEAYPNLSETLGSLLVRVSTVSERDSISMGNRAEGMSVLVASKDTIYTLFGGVTNEHWVPGKIHDKNEDGLDLLRVVLDFNKETEDYMEIINPPGGEISNGDIFLEAVSIAIEEKSIDMRLDKSHYSPKALFISTFAINILEKSLMSDIKGIEKVTESLDEELARSLLSFIFFREFNPNLLAPSLLITDLKHKYLLLLKRSKVNIIKRKGVNNWIKETEEIMF